MAGIDCDIADSASGAAALTLTILGSGTSSGVPVVGCSCAVCRSGLPRNRRSRCSALLSWNGHNILIDTATDLRQQSLDNNVRHIDAVLYTHGHADHVHGIDDLRAFNALSGQDIPVYGPQWVISDLLARFGYAFRSSQSAGFRPHLHAQVLSESIELFGRQVTPLTLLHGTEPVYGYRVADVAYLTDCSEIPALARRQLRGLQVLVIDGLRFREHPTHMTVKQAIAVGRQLGAQRIILTHLSHDVDYPLHSRQLPEHVEFAYDGLTVTVNDSKIK